MNESTEVNEHVCMHIHISTHLNCTVATCISAIISDSPYDNYRHPFWHIHPVFACVCGGGEQVPERCHKYVDSL